MEDVSKEYQGLFNLMSREHGLILTIGEMDEIIREAQNVVHENSSSVSVINSICDNKFHNGQIKYTGRCNMCGSRYMM